MGVYHSQLPLELLSFKAVGFENQIRTTKITAYDEWVREMRQENEEDCECLTKMYKKAYGRELK